jgi:hypothetical protein
MPADDRYSVGDAARLKVSAPLADPTWHANEHVERVEPVTVVTSGVPEDMVLLFTSSENLLGARVNGRILLAWEETDTTDFAAGARNLQFQRQLAHVYCQSAGN